MHGWEHVETARCTRCGIYTPTGDLAFASDGRPFCSPCGGPPIPVPSPPASFEWAPPTRTPIERAARLVAVAMLLVTLAFPLAACASQL